MQFSIGWQAYFKVFGLEQFRGHGLRAPPAYIVNFTLSLCTLACVLAISVGQLLFKKAAMVLPDPISLEGIVLNGWLIAALLLYAATTLGWIWILRHAPLHLAYPFMGLAFIAVPTLAWLFLGEPMRWQTIAGGGLIMAGLMLASAN